MASEKKRTGKVKSLGPLVDAEEKFITGQTVTDGDRVTLFLNDVPVITTHSHVSGKSKGRFYFKCKELADYIGDEDEVTIRDASGRHLKIGRHGTSHVISNGQKSRFEELTAKLGQGYVFTKFGRLSEGWTESRKLAARRLFEAVADELKREFGYVMVPAYGNLLGAVREGDFIVHDAGLFDTIYLSEHSEPELVVAEAVRIVTHLYEAGFYIKGAKDCTVYVTTPTDRSVALDFSWAWFGPDGCFDMSVGSRFEKSRDRDGFLKFADACIGNWPVKIPGNAEEILFQLYGENWRIPDQGLNAGARLTRDERYLFSDTQLAEVKDLQKRSRKRG